jgi:hypothetical protein
MRVPHNSQRTRLGLSGLSVIAYGAANILLPSTATINGASYGATDPIILYVDGISTVLLIAALYAIWTTARRKDTW